MASVRVKLSCWCGGTRPDNILRESDGDKWCTLACGHIQHMACIYRWSLMQPRAKKLCPTCKAPIRLMPAKPGQTPDQRDPKLIQLYFEGDPRSEPDTQYSDGVHGRDGIESEEEEEEEEEAQPEKGRDDQLANLRQQVRELGNTLRDVKTEKDFLRKALDAADEERRDLVGERDALQKEVEELAGTSSEHEDEIDELRAEIEQYKAGQPDLREEMAELEAENGQLEEDKLELEARVQVLEKQVENAANLARETEDSWNHEKLEWDRVRSRLKERIQQEGNSGAVKIRELKKELDDQETLILKLRCDKDRLEITTKDTIENLKASHEAEITAAKSDVVAAEKSAKLAKDAAKKAQLSEQKILASIASWRDKCDKKSEQILKLKDEIRHLKLLAAPRVGVVSSPPHESNSPAPPTNSHSSPSKSRRRHHIPPSSPEGSPPPFKINTNNGSIGLGGAGSSTAKRRKVEVLVISDTDEEGDEEEEVGPVTKKFMAMPSLLGGVGGGSAGAWGPGARKPELTKLASDRHLPAFDLGGVIGGAPKSKVKVKIGKK